MTIVYIGLGSNLDNPEQHIKSAIGALGELQSCTLIKASSLYKTKPVGPQDQDDFINAVIELETELEAIALLNALQTIEQKHGRKRKDERWGPRTLDLDIIMFGNEIINNEQLTIPHVEMKNRAFVMVPLAEINPDGVIAGQGAIKDALSRLDAGGVERML